MRNSFRALILLGAGVFVPAVTFAQAALNQQVVPSQCNGVGGCQSVCDIAQLAQNLMNLGVYVAVFASAILFAYAGVKAMTAGGNSHAYSDAVKVFTNVALGLTVILVAWIAVDTLMHSLMNSSFGPWNKMC